MHKDFSGQDLQGRSFKGQLLTGANFKAADIRGADFTNAILRGADFSGAIAGLQGSIVTNFSNADIRSTNFTGATLIGTKFSNGKAGLQQQWIITLMFASLLLSSLSGLFSTVTGAWSVYLLSSALGDQVAGLIIIASSIFFFFSIILEQGLQAFPKALGIAGAIVGILSIVGAIAGNASLPVSVMGGWAGVIFGTGVGIITVVLALAVSTSTAVFVVWAGAVAGGMALGLAVSVTIVASVFSSVTLEVLAGVGSLSMAVAVGGVSTYIGRQALAGDQRYAFLREMAIAFATIGGTSFRLANLTDSDFTLATLKGTDFRKANLTRTCWYCSKMLDRVRPGMTYLKNSQVRQLLTTSQGQGQNFDRQDLRGINLQEANLADASFIGANLNHSNLQSANLLGAILKQTQLEEADLTGAILTGTYIEDWGITCTTKLENVQCEYVYMRVPTKENPNPLRKPDNLRKTFAEGEFADFIQPFFDTLDLYHSQDVDPRAISIALRNLSANHPDDNLQFVAMERRGNTGLNLRFTTTPRANKSELSHEYFANYAQIKKELPIAVQMQLAEQDAEIRTLKGTIEQFIQTGTHQSTIQAEIVQLIQGESVVTENRGININAGDNAHISGLSSGDGIVNLGTISGNVTNAINQLPDPSEPEQPNLKDLLTQLQQAIQIDADLPDPDKSDLLEQVQALAKVKQTEELTKREGITRKAMKIFDATLKSLPDTAKIAEACSKLLPLILKALGFPV